jgi:hypothetical protein
MEIGVYIHTHMALTGFNMDSKTQFYVEKKGI